MLLRSYKFRLYPTSTQEAKLGTWLSGCCELYNACLQERKEAWTKARKSLSQYDQQNQLPAVRSNRLDIADIGSQILQNVTIRVDKAFKAFFRRVKSGQTPGYPRFKSWSQYDSFTSPTVSHNSITNKRVYIPSFGHVKWSLWKPINELGKPKTLTVKREADGWYAVLACETLKTETPLWKNYSLGIDVGLKNLVTTSKGDVLGDLAPFKAAEAKLRIAQRSVSRKTKGSNRRRKAVGLLARQHQHLARARKAQLDIISKRLVDTTAHICMEDLNLVQLTHLGGGTTQGRGLRRNWHHAAIGQLRHMLTYKAESAGRKVLLVDPRGTTIDCSSCGTRVSKSLGDRMHLCACGLSLDRDHNAAKNIQQRGLQLLRGSRLDSLRLGGKLKQT